MDRLEPIKPDQNPNKKYKDPISLWFVLSNQIKLKKNINPFITKIKIQNIIKYS